jgi:uncharacterized protein YqhQ
MMMIIVSVYCGTLSLNKFDINVMEGVLLSHISICLFVVYLMSLSVTQTIQSGADARLHEMKTHMICFFLRLYI